MSIITRAQTVLSPAVAGLTLLVLAASPTLASTHNQTVTPNQASSATNSVKLTPAKTLLKSTKPCFGISVGADE